MNHSRLYLLQNSFHSLSYLFHYYLIVFNFLFLKQYPIEFKLFLILHFILNYLNELCHLIIFNLKYIPLTITIYLIILNFVFLKK